MSDPLRSDPAVSPPPAAGEGDTEEVDAVLVTPGALPEHPRRSAAAVVPAVQAAAVAATGFFAGAAAAGLVRRHRRRRDLAAFASRRRSLARSQRGGARRGGSRAAGELVQIVGTRSLLVDVHLLGTPGRDR